jgi:seryl-tRNA synthetase
MNALANEAQRQELEYKEKLRVLQEQADALQRERDNAQACVAKLQEQARNADARIDASEKKAAEANRRADIAESQFKGLRVQFDEREKAVRILRDRSEALQKQLSTAPVQPAPSVAAAAAQPNPAPTAPVQPSVNPAAENLSGNARLQARKILADARLYADTARERMQKQAQEQKDRMAENARGIAAGVLVLKDRLARVDEKLDQASMELENATSAIYQALEDTSVDLENLGTTMEQYANGTPETDAPEVQPTKGSEPQSKSSWQQNDAVASAQAAVPDPAKPAPVQYRVKRVARPTVRPVYRPGRMRQIARSKNRPVAQDLSDAISRMGQDKE